MTARFIRNRRDGKLLGVAAGLADLTGVDATLVRLGFVGATLLTGPVVPFFYVIAALVAPAE